MARTTQRKLPAPYHAFLAGRGHKKEPVTLWLSGRLRTSVDFRYQAVLSRSTQRGWLLPEGLTLVGVDAEYPFEDVYIDERDVVFEIIGVITGQDPKSFEQGLRNARHLALSLGELLMAGSFAQEQSAKFSYRAYARSASANPHFAEHARVLFRMRSVPVMRSAATRQRLVTATWAC